MLIKKFTLDNITCFKHLELNFTMFNAIYGSDGTGKSTIKDALELLITNKCSSRLKEHLLKSGTTAGRIYAEVELDNETKVLAKNLLGTSVNNDGMTQQKLLDTLKVTKPALELLADVWKALRSSEAELTGMIDRALSENISREQVIQEIVELIPAEHKEGAQALLNDEIKRTTSDMLATALSKIQKATKGITSKRTELNVQLKVVEDKLALLKSVNLDKVKLARSKIMFKQDIERTDAEIVRLQIIITQEEKSSLEISKQLETLGRPIDLVILQSNHDATDKELAEKRQELKNLPTALKTETTLPCKWFGICGIKDKSLTEMIRATNTCNTDKAAKLENTIVLLEKKLTEIKAEIAKAKANNWTIDSTTAKLAQCASTISTYKDLIKNLVKTKDELNKNMPKVEDGIGDALFTMADEAEKMTTERGQISSDLNNLIVQEPLLKLLEEAIKTVDASKKTTRQDTFRKIMLEGLTILFDKASEFRPGLGYFVDNLDIHMLSMSQKQRVGLALQYAAAKTSGVNIIMADDMNVITKYKTTETFLKHVLEDNVSVFLFSSLKGKHENIGIETNVIDLDEQNGW